MKVSRLIKRRTLAKEVCDQGRVSINGQTAKASSDVAVGDRIRIRFGHKTLEAHVDRIAEAARKEESSEMYTVLSEVYNEKTDHPS